MDLQDVLKNQIFGIVDSVNPETKYKMLVVDKTVQDIMGYCVEKHDLLDRQVANILLLDQPRPSEAYLPAIYICEPCRFNAACIAADFTRLPNRYQKAYVFFLPGPAAPLITDLKSRLGHRLARIEVAPIFFWPIERKTFTLGDVYGNDRLYNANVRTKEEYIARMASQIANVCRALGEEPYIRHVQPSGGYRESALPGLLATSVNSQLARDNPQATGDRKGRAMLLILDRSVDPMAPLLHEFTYQAMATDLLEFGTGNNYESEDKTVKGKLDEKDVDWVELRHLHISQVTEELTARVKALREANPHFADKTTDVSVHDIRNMMANLPSFVKSKDQVALNLQIALDCIAQMDARMLKELAELEQTTALGVDADGERPAHLTDDLVKLLAQKNVSSVDKIRLIAVYVLSRQTGLFVQDYERLRRHSNLSESDIESIINLANFGHQTIKSNGDITSAGLSTTQRNGDSEPVYYSEATGEQFLFARFVPGVKNIVEKLILNQLDQRQFPYVGDTPENESDALDTATSLRNPRQRATWVKNKVNQPAKQRVIVFMIGGFTASEARSAYELSQKYPKDVVIGGNDLLTPNKFVMALRRQNLSLQNLMLPRLNRDGPAPDFLLESDRDTSKRTAAAAAAQPSLGQAPPPQGVPSTSNGNEIQNAQAQAQSLQPAKESKRRGLFSRKKK